MSWHDSIPGVSDYDPEWPVEWCDVCGYDVDECECLDPMHDAPPELREEQGR